MARPALTAVPAQRSSLPVLKARRRLVLGALVGAAACGVLSAAAWIFSPDPPAAVVEARDEEAIALATLAAQDYLAGRDSVVPAADGVTTAFSRGGGAVVPEAELVFSGSTQYRMGDKPGAVTTVERVTFQVRGATQLLELSIPMVLRSSGWVLGAAPSLLPAEVAVTDQEVGLDYAEIYTTSGDANDLAGLAWGQGITAQVQRWAQAYASSGADSAELFALTGDDDPTHAYAGLGGWSVESATVLSFAAGANTGDRAGEFGSTWVAVRVALVLSAPGANGPTLTADYDLLFEPELNPAAPPVTAWGPAGVGPTSAIADYGNATTKG